MNGPDLPDLWRNRDRYSVEEAVRLWAFALAGVPLDQPMKASERNDYRREYEAARQELIQSVPLQSEEEMVEVMRRVPGPSFVDSWRHDSFGRAPSHHKVTERRTRHFFLGPDLAAYAKKRGRPGLFGFEEGPEPVELRADTKEGYLYLIGLLAHALAERGGPKFGNGKRPNQSGLAEAIRDTADKLQASTNGLGASTLHEKLSQALEEVENRRKAGP